MIKTGIIGCGSMGGGMARRLHGEGIAVTCYDSSGAARDALAKAGLVVRATARELAGEVDLLILSLPRAAIVEDVMREIHDDVSAGTVILDTSTSEPATSQALARQAAGRGYTFIDAPVSGGQTAAANGTMTMLLGGNVDVLATLEPVLALLTHKRVAVGASGAGNAAKIANNMLCAANLVLVAEALRLAKAVGVPAESLLEGVNAGSGRSGVSEVNYPRWILNGSYDSGFTMGLMRKDVNLALALADENGMALPAFEGIAKLWNDSRDAIDDSADFNQIHRYAETDR